MPERVYISYREEKFVLSLDRSKASTLMEFDKMPEAMEAAISLGYKNISIRPTRAMLAQVIEDLEQTTDRYKLTSAGFEVIYSLARWHRQCARFYLSLSILVILAVVLFVPSFYFFPAGYDRVSTVRLLLVLFACYTIFLFYAWGKAQLDNFYQQYRMAKEAREREEVRLRRKYDFDDED